MAEIVYPADGAALPVLPAAKASTVSLRTQKHRSKQEYFPIVDTSGKVVAKALRDYCHGPGRPLHPVIHLYLIDRRERIYLQKRSAAKDICPGLWDTSVGGHVIFGESVTEALIRESAEEIGLQEFNPVELGCFVSETDIERELVSIFAAVGSFRPKPDKVEVVDGKWWTIPEIEHAVGKGILTSSLEREFKSIKQKLLALL